MGPCGHRAICPGKTEERTHFLSLTKNSDTWADNHNTEQNVYRDYEPGTHPNWGWGVEGEGDLPRGGDSGLCSERRMEVVQERGRTFLAIPTVPPQERRYRTEKVSLEIKARPTTNCLGGYLSLNFILKEMGNEYWAREEGNNRTCTHGFSVVHRLPTLL